MAEIVNRCSLRRAPALIAGFFINSFCAARFGIVSPRGRWKLSAARSPCHPT